MNVPKEGRNMRVILENLHSEILDLKKSTTADRSGEMVQALGRFESSLNRLGSSYRNISGGTPDDVKRRYGK